jgi:hypothetical protein
MNKLVKVLVFPWLAIIWFVGFVMAYLGDRKEDE